MDRAGLEYAVDRVLQIARRGHDGRMETVPDQWCPARAIGEGFTVIETVLIVAVAENGVIGRDNTIPWRLKADQQRFKGLTLNKPVIMGRQTVTPLPRALPR